jgi:hypothetical protein
VTDDDKILEARNKLDTDSMAHHEVNVLSLRPER